MLPAAEAQPAASKQLYPFFGAYPNSMVAMQGGHAGRLVTMHGRPG